MGAVKIEVDKSSLEWDLVKLNSVDTVKALILNRYKFDEFYVAKKEYTTDPYVSNGIYTFYESISCVYIDLDILIKESSLTENQYNIVQLFMTGYNKYDIAKELEIDIRAIMQSLNKACLKIVNTYNYKKQEYDEINGFVKISNDVKYKRCTKCGKDLRINNENYTTNGNSGFYSVCRMCKI